VLASLAAAAGYLTWNRAQLWSSVILLWEDSAAKSPGKARVHVGLGNAYLHVGRCAEAAQQYHAASLLQRADFMLDFNWASAYDCMHRPDLAADMLLKATADKPTASAYAMLGYTLAEQRAWPEALESLRRAEELDPAYAATYAYRGMILSAIGRPDLAGPQFDKCLEIDPGNIIARNGRAALNANLSAPSY
jgi:tetratricopeptide (TPR) repeat protein